MKTYILHLIFSVTHGYLRFVVVFSLIHVNLRHFNLMRLFCCCCRYITNYDAEWLSSFRGWKIWKMNELNLTFFLSFFSFATDSFWFIQPLKLIHCWCWKLIDSFSFLIFISWRHESSLLHQIVHWQNDFALAKFLQVGKSKGRAWCHVLNDWMVTFSLKISCYFFFLRLKLQWNKVWIRVRNYCRQQ